MTKKNQSKAVKSDSNANKLHDHYQYAFNLLRQHKLLDSHEVSRQHFNSKNINQVSQVEFQPGSHCDLYRCPHCYGHGQAQMDGHLELEQYKRVLDEIQGYVPLIQISGVATEPLTHPQIIEIIRAAKERGFHCGLHTKGYRLTPELIDLLTDDVLDRESFITISVDAAESKDYIKVHHIDTCQTDIFRHNAENYFEIVLKNIKDLYTMRQAKGSNLRINIAHLLFKQNSSLNQLDRFIELFGQYCDVIRFSLSQKTNYGKTPNSISEEERTVIKKLKSKYRNNPKVSILSMTDVGHNTFFKKCYAQRFQAVVDKAGNVFPCPQTALKDYEWLAYGNIKNDSLKNILFSETRTKLFDADVDSVMRCRICDRKDEDINITIDRLLE